MQPANDSHLPRPPAWREIALALGLLYAGTFALLLLSWGVPAVTGSLQALLAVMLLLIPTFVLRGTGVRIDDLGVAMGPWRRTAGLSLATMAAVFSVYALGNHFGQQWLFGLEPHWDAQALLRWDEALEDAPPDPCTRAADSVVAWTDRSGLWILGQPRARLEVEPRAAGSLGHARGVRCAAGSRPRPTRAVMPTGGVYRLRPNEGLWLPLAAEQRELAVAVRLDGQPVPAGRLRLGAFGETAESDGLIEGSRSLWWLLTFIVVHLALVALPEEWFFRGYLQTRLDQRLGTPVTILGARLGWGVVLAALAFALLHPILVHGVHRLAVFFPALLFGWLRARAGNIGAAVVVHAAANLLQAVLGRMYG